MDKRICPKCRKEYSQPYTCSRKQWDERYKFCSISCAKKGNKLRLGISYPAWNKGKKSPYPAWNKGKGDYAKKLGFGKWMTGKKSSLATRKKQSEIVRKRIVEGKHNF